MTAWIPAGPAAAESLAPDPVLADRLESRGVGLLDPFTAGATPTPVHGGGAFLLGAVGGVGVSTLARLSGAGEGIDPERLRGLVGVDVDSGFWGGIPFGAPVWVISRVEVHSLSAAQALASRYSRGLLPVTLAGLVLSYPPYRSTAEEVRSARVLSRLFSRTLAFPWVDGIEALDAPDLPVRARKTITAVQLSAVTDGTTEGEQP